MAARPTALIKVLAGRADAKRVDSVMEQLRVLIESTTNDMRGRIVDRVRAHDTDASMQQR